MMNNIFENAKFGDKFRTRDGRMAIYLGCSETGGYKYRLFIEGNTFFSWVDDEGCYDYEEHPQDIVSRWKEEPINEEELVESATIDIEHACQVYCKTCMYRKDKCETDWKCQAYADFRKAMEE